MEMIWRCVLDVATSFMSWSGFGSWSAVISAMPRMHTQEQELQDSYSLEADEISLASLAEGRSDLSKHSVCFDGLFVERI